MKLLGKLALGETKTLILTDGSKAPVYLSGRNVPHVSVLPFSDATAYDILHADALVIESAALGSGTSHDEETPAPKARAAKPAAKKSAVKKVAKKAAKAAKPKAAKKAPAKKAAKKAVKKAAKKVAKKAKKGGAKKVVAKKKGGAKRKK
jgi:type IV secretory pathway VirB6-like protein